MATWASLASAYQATGRMPSALQLSEQVCADSAEVLGADHPDTLARCLNLANLYYAVGRVRDAVALLRDTAIRSDQVLPPGDPLTLAVHQGLGNIGQG
jgi:Tetratricopeptide repeat